MFRIIIAPSIFFVLYQVHRGIVIHCDLASSYIADIAGQHLKWGVYIHTPCQIRETITPRFGSLFVVVIKGKAWEWANTRKGYWRTAGSWILCTTLTNERLANLGFDNFSKRYEALRSSY
jgi:hypothetical protein